MPQLHPERCRRCSGKGKRWTTVEGVAMEFICGTCHGLGEKTYAASAEKRAATNAKAKERKAKKLIHNIETFIGEHPHVYTWMNTSNFPFAKKMHEALLRWGSLTDRQLAASLKCVRRDT